MNNWLFTFFNYFMIFYSGGLILSYLLMTIVSFIQIHRRKKYYSAEYIKRILLNSPHTPGISIVAPAYNEETTVVDNVNSLLGMDYPKFEVIIVNDGSKDKTLEKLIENFDLVEVPYNYIEYIKTKPYKRLFKSTNEKYKRLVVVDKENGGTKADASNAGVNVAQYPYFVCTDVDCILNPQGLYYLIWDVLSSDKRVIAVSATMRMANGCTMKDGRLSEVRFIDVNTGITLSTHNIPYGSKLYIAEGDKVTKGQKVAEWNPYIRPIITEVSGKLNFVDLIDGVSVNEVRDEATGVSSRVVVDWKTGLKKKDLNPAIFIIDEKGNTKTLSTGSIARYIISTGTILSSNNGDEVQAGDIIAYIPREDSKTKDITGGLPRVAELFEARRPKDAALIADIDGIIRFEEDYKSKYKVAIVPNEGDPVEYLISKTTALNVQDGDIVKRGDKLIEGKTDPHDILRIFGVEELSKYLVGEIQGVYRLQGVEINDKHIEVIVRQMLRKKEIIDAGATTFVVGEYVDEEELLAENKKALEAGGKPAQARPYLLGITKASLQTRSFISAASFQETTKVLIESAIAGKEDMLEGLKENVIVGRLIPAGTGAYVNRLKAIAKAQDQELEAEQVEELNKKESADLTLPGIA